MKVQDIVFMQGDDAIEALEILDKEGFKAVIEHLSQWDNGDGEIIDFPGGLSDDHYWDGTGKYILTWNDRFGYIGLVKVQ